MHTTLYNNPKQIDWLHPIVIDFESYYGADWTLAGAKSVTTEEYIRGDKWEMIGVSIKNGDTTTQFYRREEGLSAIAYLLKTFPNRPVISHNNSFDLGVLGLRYNMHPNFTVDTVVMAKLCGLDRVACGASLDKLSRFLEKIGVVKIIKGDTVHNMRGVHADDMTEQQWQEYGDYCKLDTNLAYDMYMYMLQFFDVGIDFGVTHGHRIDVSELIMSDITTKMWTQPKIDLDYNLLKNYNQSLKETKQNMLAELAKNLKYTDLDELLSELRSRDKFADILGRYVIVPMKISDKTGKETYAISKTDKEFMNLLEHDDPLVVALVEARLGVASNIEETRSGRFMSIAKRGLMPIPLRYASAHTGRYGGCFKYDTKVLCLTAEQCIMEKNIVDVLLSDLVWDGEEWCEHSGVEFNGYQEVITYDGLTGTKNHRVFIDEATETTLFEAMRTGTPIMDCKLPPNWKGKDTSVGKT